MEGLNETPDSFARSNFAGEATSSGDICGASFERTPSTDSSRDTFRTVCTFGRVPSGVKVLLPAQPAELTEYKVQPRRSVAFPFSQFRLRGIFA